MKILRTGAGSAPSEGVIQALIQEGCEVFTADCDKLSYGLEKYPGITIPPADDDNFIPAIMQVVEDYNIDAIIPAVDEELYPLAQHREEIESLGAKLVVSPESTCYTFQSKIHAARKMHKAGLKVPTTTLVPFDLNPPLILKDNKGRGGAGFRVLKTRVERDAIVSAVCACGGPLKVYQSFIQGQEYTVDALCDFSGKMVCGCVRERIQTESGVCSKSRVVDYPEILEDVTKLTEAFKFYGPINAQCIVASDGQRYWIDVNPRYAGTVCLSIAAGVPMVSALVRMLNGEDISSDTWVTPMYGVTMLRYWSEIYLRT